MNFEMPKYVVSQKYAFGVVIVEFSDKSMGTYDAVKLGCDWLRMSNDSFYDHYGFNFNPHKIPVLYEKCQKIVYRIGWR